MFKKIPNFLGEVKTELKKVSWSTKEDLISSTMVVLVSVLFLALFIGLCDYLLSTIMGIIIK
ncbi:MAG: preprotein translocase subunit SecE [Candidatus Omnitrophica bacterium]|nr:preprotein translocase subunit SecE [Candidatus Omnitrophota bacterium]